MAQVDLLNYFSIISWFILLFFVFYFINYSYILPLIYNNLKFKYNRFIYTLSRVKSKYNIFVTINDDVFLFLGVFNNLKFLKFNYNYYVFLYKYIIYNI